MKKLFQLVIVAFLAAFMIGCANTSQLEAVEADVETLKAQMKEVPAEAAEANQRSKAAEQKASDTNSKLDRMFKKSMMK